MHLGCSPVSSSILSATVRWKVIKLFLSALALVSTWKGVCYLAFAIILSNQIPAAGINFAQLLTISVICRPTGTAIGLTILSSDHKITPPELRIEFFHGPGAVSVRLPVCYNALYQSGKSMTQTLFTFPGKMAHC